MQSRGTSGPWLESGREAGLVLSAQRGELSALYELLREYHRPLYRLCFALTRDRVAAAQLVEETARRAWKGLAQLPVGKPFFPWLVRITRNLAVTQARRNAGDVRPTARPLARPAGDPWGGEFASLADVEFEQRALVAFEHLSADDQLALALRLIERLSYADIALVLDTTPGAVMHRLSTLRENLEAAANAPGKAP